MIAPRIFIAQAARNAMAHWRVWLSSPRHPLMNLAMSVAFLVLLNKAFVVRFNHLVAVGVCVKDADTGQDLKAELESHDLRAVAYDTVAQGRTALGRGDIAAFIAMGTTSRLDIAVAFSDATPVLGKEVAAVLLRVAGAYAAGHRPGARVEVTTDACAPERMSDYVTACLLPFLIMSLGILNCGLLWVLDAERGTDATFLATPASRHALILGRLAAGITLSGTTLAVALPLCGSAIGLRWPAMPAAWCAVVILETVCASLWFFAVAACTIRYITYSQTCLTVFVVALFITSGVMPFETMPFWLRFIAVLSPSYHACSLMRATMLGIEPLRLSDVLILCAWSVAAYQVTWLRLMRERRART